MAIRSRVFLQVLLLLLLAAGVPAAFAAASKLEVEQDGEESWTDWAKEKIGLRQHHEDHEEKHASKKGPEAAKEMIYGEYTQEHTAFVLLGSGLCSLLIPG